MMERKRKMNKVIIIDDDKELCFLMKKCVEQENYIGPTRKSQPGCAWRAADGRGYLPAGGQRPRAEQGLAVPATHF